MLTIQRLYKKNAEAADTLCQQQKKQGQIISNQYLRLER